MITSMLPKLEVNPFPWCCNESMKQEECETMTKPLQKNVEIIRDLKIWCYIALIGSIAVFVIFIMKSITKPVTSPKLNSWITFLYHFMLFIFGGKQRLAASLHNFSNVSFCIL